MSATVTAATATEQQLQQPEEPQVFDPVRFLIERYAPTKFFDIVIESLLEAWDSHKRESTGKKAKQKSKEQYPDLNIRYIFLQNFSKIS